MSDHARLLKLNKRLANLKQEEDQLKLRIAAYEKVVKAHDQKNPQKWHEATRELKTLRGKRRENMRRQEQIRDILGK